MARRVAPRRPGSEVAHQPPHNSNGDAHDMLTPDTLPAVQAALADAGVDGWLL